MLFYIYIYIYIYNMHVCIHAHICKYFIYHLDILNDKKLDTYTKK